MNNNIRYVVYPKLGHVYKYHMSFLEVMQMSKTDAIDPELLEGDNEW